MTEPLRRHLGSNAGDGLDPVKDEMDAWFWFALLGGIAVSIIVVALGAWLFL